MKVFMIGGTGLLGSEGAKELIQRGHQVTSIALPPIPQGAHIPEAMTLTLGNYMEMTDEALLAAMSGCEGFVFAAGIDERVEGPAPIYDMFDKYNIKPLDRLLRLAKASGIKHAVVLGSYFVHFAKSKPEWEMTKYHPYIRSRVDQENLALSYASQGMDVAVLELPYIFGTQPGRKPVWTFVADMIESNRYVTMYPGGGTTMVTVKQVGQCIAGALERTRGGVAYPVGYYNMTWKEMLTIMHKHMGLPGKKVLTVPKALFRLGMKSVVKEQQKKNHEGGLDMVRFADVMCGYTYIDAQVIVKQLGVTPDDIDGAIGDSMRLCQAIKHQHQQVVEMKAE